MSLMQQIQRGPRARPRRITVFGVQGVGKTTLAAAAPAPIFIPTEDGQNDIDCHRFPLASAYVNVLAALGELYSEQHDYRTAVVDSLDWLERLIWADVCRQKGVESIEDIGYAKGYTYALSQWREVLDGLDALRNSRDMTVILVAHAKIERFEDPTCDSYDRFVPRPHKSAAALVQEWSDEVLFATYKIHTKQSDEGFGRKKARGLGTGERILRTTERPAHVAKNRLGLPDELPLLWSAYAEYLPPLSSQEN